MASSSYLRSHTDPFALFTALPRLSDQKLAWNTIWFYANYIEHGGEGWSGFPDLSDLVKNPDGTDI